MNISRKKFILTILGATASTVLMDGFFLERFYIEENYYSFNKGFNGKSPLRILQVSDLHLRSIDGIIKKLLSRIKLLSPDIVCFTGDAIDESHNIPLLNSFLELIPASIPKVAILGNWENMINLDFNELRRTYLKHNCQLLVNDSVSIVAKGRKVAITGIDEHITGRPNFERAISKSEVGDINLLLCHSPGYIDIVKRKLLENKFRYLGFDAVLSGHTHGGQINILGFVPHLPAGSSNYLKGWYYKNERAPLYVSKGIGTTIIPLRIGARSEITVFDYL